MDEIQMLDRAFRYLSSEIQQLMLALPLGIKRGMKEIRIRAGKPLVLFMGGESLILTKTGQVSERVSENSYIVSRKELDEIFRSVCDYSVHTFQEELIQGFVTVRGGHRVGICGTGIMERGQVVGMKEVSSINFRLARQVKGVSDELFRRVFSNGLQSVLIIGAPASGKTTLIKDIIRELANGRLGWYVKVAVIDERAELAAMYRGEAQNDIGVSSDVYHLYPKAQGMSMALRTASPQVLVCDEIGSEDDADYILQSMNAGVSVIASAHADSFDNAMKREHIAKLVNHHAFSKVVILDSRGQPCVIRELIEIDGKAEEKSHEYTVEPVGAGGVQLGWLCKEQCAVRQGEAARRNPAHD